MDIIKISILSLLALFLIMPVVALAASDVTLNGSTTVTNAVIIPNKQRIQDKSGVEFQYFTSSSGRGFFALLNEEADMAMSSSSFENLLKKARNSGYEVNPQDYEVYELGRVALEFIVSANNPVKSLTIDQIQGILLGEVTDWATVGYPELGTLKLVTEHPSGGMFSTAQSLLLGGKRIRTDKALTLQKGPQVPVVVGQLDHGIGLFTSAIPKPDHVRTLDVVGMDAEQTLIIIIREGEKEKAVRRLLDTLIEVSAPLRD